MKNTKFREMKICSNVAKIVSFLAAVWTLTGCGDERLDHAITNEDFEESIQFVWYDPYGNAAHAAEMKQPGWWGYGVKSTGIQGCKVKCSLSLYDGDEKHFMSGYTRPTELPIEIGATSHVDFEKEVIKGGWRMWLDYELYGPDGGLLLKGSKLSEPSPVMEGHDKQAASTGDSGLDNLVKGCGDEIRKVLNTDRWAIEVKADSIVVESKSKVEVYYMVSPYDGMKPTHEKYRIELRFRDMLPKDEYVELVKKRAEVLAVVNYGAKTKDEWSRAGAFLRNNPLPRYTTMDENGKQYSVYFSSYDSPNVSIAPAKVYAEVKGAEALIDQLFSRLAQ